MNKMPTPDSKEPSIEAGTAHRANHTKIDLRQVKGGIVEIWRCKPDIFAATYDRVEDDARLPLHENPL